MDQDLETKKITKTKLEQRVAGRGMDQPSFNRRNT